LLCMAFETAGHYLLVVVVGSCLRAASVLRPLVYLSGLFSAWIVLGEMRGPQSPVQIFGCCFIL